MLSYRRSKLMLHQGIGETFRDKDCILTILWKVVMTPKGQTLAGHTCAG